MTKSLKKSAAEIGSSKRPDIFRYHDHRKFLADLVAHLKLSQPGFSLRSLAQKAGLAVGYVSMVLGGTRTLSNEALEKMARPLGLSAAEKTHLELLRLLGESDSQEVRVSALERIQKFGAYQRTNPKESETYRYLTNWVNVAIREMVSLQDFRADPEWIVERLRNRVSQKEVEESIKFLAENRYIEVLPGKKATLPKKNLDCIGDVFSVVLGQFHREMFRLAAQSYDNAKQEERDIQGQTIAIAEQDWPELKKILSDTLDKIGELEKRPGAKEAVYHIAFSAFPLTKPKKV